MSVWTGCPGSYGEGAPLWAVQCLLQDFAVFGLCATAMQSSALFQCQGEVFLDVADHEIRCPDRLRVIALMTV